MMRGVVFQGGENFHEKMISRKYSSSTDAARRMRKKIIEEKKL